MQDNVEKVRNVLEKLLSPALASFIRTRINENPEPGKLLTDIFDALPVADQERLKRSHPVFRTEDHLDDIGVRELLGLVINPALRTKLFRSHLPPEAFHYAHELKYLCSRILGHPTRRSLPQYNSDNAHARRDLETVSYLMEALGAMVEAEEVRKIRASISDLENRLTIGKEEALDIVPLMQGLRSKAPGLAELSALTLSSMGSRAASARELLCAALGSGVAGAKHALSNIGADAIPAIADAIVEAEKAGDQYHGFQLASVFRDMLEKGVEPRMFASALPALLDQLNDLESWEGMLYEYWEEGWDTSLLATIAQRCCSPMNELIRIAESREQKSRDDWDLVLGVRGVIGIEGSRKTRAMRAYDERGAMRAHDEEMEEDWRGAWEDAERQRVQAVALMRAIHRSAVILHSVLKETTPDDVPRGIEPEDEEYFQDDIQEALRVVDLIWTPLDDWLTAHGARPPSKPSEGNGGESKQLEGPEPSDDEMTPDEG